MSDGVERKTLSLMLEAEAKAIDDMPGASLDDLVLFFHEAIADVLDSDKLVSYIVQNDRPEAMFSTFRVLKAVMAEIEYRIKENKI